MEKLKSLSSVIFIMVALLVLSCQKKTKIEENTIVKGDTITTITKEVTTDTIVPGINTTNWKDESNQLKERLDKIGAKAKQKGGELGKKIKERINTLESERKSYRNDTTKADFKERWKTFKEKTNSAIDSLDKKFDKKMDKTK